MTGTRPPVAATAASTAALSSGVWRNVSTNDRIDAGFQKSVACSENAACAFARSSALR